MSALTTIPPSQSPSPADVTGYRQAAVDATQEQYLTFMLGSETFAIGILSIKEIIEYDTLTVVPMMPASIRGVINLRGAVVPVIDLCIRFCRPSAEVTKRSCIVIVEIQHDGERQDVGVIVDEVNAVLDIASNHIEPAPSFGARIRADFITGIASINGSFVILLNVDRVLAVEDFLAHAATTQLLTDESSTGPLLA